MSILSMMGRHAKNAIIVNMRMIPTNIKADRNTSGSLAYLVKILLRIRPLNV